PIASVLLPLHAAVVILQLPVFDRHPGGISRSVSQTLEQDRRGMEATALSRRAMLGSALASGACALLPSATSADTRLVMNDASRLNPTPVMKHIVRTAGPDEELIAAIRAALKEAAASKQPVAVGAARHSLGGQSLPRDGTAITLRSPRIESDTAAAVYRVN